MTADKVWMPGEKNDEQTFYWGDHSRVVERPPQQNRASGASSDPTQNEDIVRWECLDCGLDVQGERIGMVFSSRECPARGVEENRPRRDVGDTETGGSVDLSTLTVEHYQLAHDIADDTELCVEHIAQKIKQLHRYNVPTKEIEQTVRNVAARGGET